DRARFGLPEVTLGFNPAYGIARLLDVLGGGHGRDLLLTGRTLHATEALRIGLVNRVVAAPTLAETAAAWAAEIAKSPREGQAALHAERGQLVAHARGDDLDVLRHRVEQQDRELVAAVAGDDVGGPRRLRERVGHRAQHLVTQRVAEAVVHRLELHHV